MRHERRPSAVLSRRSPTSVSHIAVPLKRLTATAAGAGMPRPESILATSRLADREIGSLPRRWRLAFEAWQLCANQWPVDRPLIDGWLRRFVDLLLLQRLPLLWTAGGVDGFGLNRRLVMVADWR